MGEVKAIRCSHCNKGYLKINDKYCKKCGYRNEHYGTFKDYFPNSCISYNITSEKGKKEFNQCSDRDGHIFNKTWLIIFFLLCISGLISIIGMYNIIKSKR